MYWEAVAVFAAVDTGSVSVFAVLEVNILKTNETWPKIEITKEEISISYEYHGMTAKLTEKQFAKLYEQMTALKEENEKAEKGRHSQTE